MHVLRSASLSAALGILPAAPTLAADFPAVVVEILQRQSDGPISQMSAAKKNAVIECVNKVLVDMPNGKKRYVLEGADFDDREQRFGKVLLEERAEWKQNIARACASLALSGGV